jgi:hypothetical protein
VTRARPSFKVRFRICQRSNDWGSRERGRNAVSIAPELLVSRWRKLGVPDRVLDVAVVPFVGQRVTAGVPQHVRVGLEDGLRLLASAFDHAGEPRGSEWRAALGREHRVTWALARVGAARGRAVRRPGSDASPGCPAWPGGRAEWRWRSRFDPSADRQAPRKWPLASSHGNR